MSSAIILLLLLGTLLSSEGANITNVRIGNIQPNKRSGVLEVEVNGNTWGIVCDDRWATNQANAIVACRSLGFTNGGTAELSGKYGSGTGDFLLDDTDCASDMTSLAQCQSAQGHDCTKGIDKAVGIDCNQVSGQGVTTFKPPETTKAESKVISDNCQTTNPTVRLFGKAGVEGMGLVQVLNSNTNQWGFVCDDGWDSQAAKVVCAQLCFPTNYTAKPGIPREHEVSPTNPTIILDDVACTGTEATLQDCPSNNFAATNNCNKNGNEFAGVQCVEAEFKPPSPPDPELKCGDGVLRADFHRSRDKNLEEKHLSVLNDPTCPDVIKSTTAQFVSITIPVDKCGTNVTRNGTHILYDNEIRYASTLEEGPITRLNTYRVSIECAMPVDKVVTQRVEAVTQAVTKKSDGVIVANMDIFRSDSFDTPVTENPVKIPLGEYLNLAVIMEDYDSRLKLVVTDCVSTPTGDTSNTRLTKVLFKDKCKEEITLSTYPISKFEFGFRFKPFKFVNYPLLYIQCNAIICLASEVTNECDRSCGNTKPTTSGRKRRSAFQRKSLISPAILLYDPNDPYEGSNSGVTAVKDKENEIVVIDYEDTNDARTPSPSQQTTWKLFEKTSLIFNHETSSVTMASGKNVTIVTQHDNEKGSENNNDNGNPSSVVGEKDGTFSKKDGNVACQPALSSLIFFTALAVSKFFSLR